MKLTFDKPLTILLIVTVICLTGSVAWACSDHRDVRLTSNQPITIKSNNNVGEGPQKCVTLNSNNYFNLQPCVDGNANQIFTTTIGYLDSSRNSVYYNIHPSSGKCFDISGRSVDGYLISYDCNGDTNQQFILTYGTSGVSIHPFHYAGTCLDDWTDGYLYSNHNCYDLQPQFKPTFQIMRPT